jgi:hypothetical protein
MARREDANARKKGQGGNFTIISQLKQCLLLIEVAVSEFISDCTTQIPVFQFLSFLFPF